MRRKLVQQVEAVQLPADIGFAGLREDFPVGLAGMLVGGPRGVELALANLAALLLPADVDRLAVSGDPRAVRPAGATGP